MGIESLAESGRITMQRSVSNFDSLVCVFGFSDLGFCSVFSRIAFTLVFLFSRFSGLMEVVVDRFGC